MLRQRTPQRGNGEVKDADHGLVRARPLKARVDNGQVEVTVESGEQDAIDGTAKVISHRAFVPRERTLVVD